MPHVTLTFDLLTPKVDLCMPLPRGPLMPICSKIGSSVFKISCSQISQRTDITPMAGAALSMAVQRQVQTSRPLSEARHMQIEGEK